MDEFLYDPLRKKNVACTPEEEVRQHLIRWLNRQQGISLMKMMSEYSFHYNGLLYRADIVVFDKELKPLMLVECKAPSVKMDRAVIEQGIRYNRVLKVRYMLFSNGTSSYLCGLNEESGEYEFLDRFPALQ